MDARTLLTPALAADKTTVKPAAEIVSGEGLFASEKIQLTDAVIANLSDYRLSTLGLFSFGSEDSSGTQSRRSLKPQAKCKTYPGDVAWPSAPIWNLIDVLLGGALIKTIPEASPCYAEWGAYSASRCQSLTDTWGNASFR